MYCKNCGKLLSADAKFCSECGTKVEVEAPKPKPAEPIFFTKESEPKVEKPKRVVHLDEFNWNLDGYPTAPKKTEDIDFNWASVLEEKARASAPRTVQPKVEEEKPVDEPVATVEELVEALPEEEPAEEDATVEEPVEAGNGELEQAIFENIEKDTIEEPTKLIDKAQLKAAGVDKFYTFNQKQAELQALLDQEYARIQNGELEDEPVEELEPAPLPEFLQVDDVIAEVEAPVDEIVVSEEIIAEPVVAETVEAAAESSEILAVEEVAAEEAEIPVVEEPEMPEVEETAVEEPAVAEAPEVAQEPAIAATELVAVVWAAAPAGVVVNETPVSETAEPEAPEEVPVMEEPVAEEVSPSKGETSENETAETNTEEPEHKLTFDDIFRDDDEDDEEEKEKGGCLKVIAILLCILVAIELAILGVQYFAPDSQAGAYIDKAYGYVINLIQGNGNVDHQEEITGPSEIQQLITKQMVKNENIVSVVENNQMHFEDGETYGYDEFGDTYAFQNSPWYDNEEGESVSFGDEIVGTVIQYYSALSDRMNDINRDVFDFVDETSAFYEEVEGIEGADDMEYVINNLEIGEIRTGASGFYVLTRVYSVDRQHPEGETEMQVVYLEPNTSKNEMKVIEIQKI